MSKRRVIYLIGLALALAAIVILVLASTSETDNSRLLSLEDAIEAQNLSAVTRILSRDRSISGVFLSRNSDLRPIHLITVLGNVEMAEILLDAGADLEADTKDGRKAIHLATERNNVRFIDFLLRRGAMLNSSDSHGRTPLMIAAFENHKELVSLFLRRRASVISESERGGPLHWALMGPSPDPAVIRLLLTHGCDPNKRSRNGYSPLDLCLNNGSIDICDELIRHGATESPFYWAAKGMIDKINAIHHVDKIKSTANKNMLHVSCQFGNERASSLLVELGVDRNLFDNDGRSPLHYASRNGNRRVVAIAYSKNSLNTPDDSGQTPLHYAVLHRHADATAELLGLGADPNVCDMKKNTPLTYASRNGDVRCCQLLLSNAANVNHQNYNGQTPLHLALNVNNLKVAEVLLNFTPNLTLTDSQGQSVFDYASDSPSVCRLFRSRGLIKNDGSRK